MWSYNSKNTSKADEKITLIVFKFKYFLGFSRVTFTCCILAHYNLACNKWDDNLASKLNLLITLEKRGKKNEVNHLHSTNTPKPITFYTFLLSVVQDTAHFFLPKAQGAANKYVHKTSQWKFLISCWRISTIDNAVSRAEMKDQHCKRAFKLSQKNSIRSCVHFYFAAGNEKKG